MVVYYMDFVLSALPEFMVVRWYWKSRSLHQQNEQKEKEKCLFLENAHLEEKHEEDGEADANPSN